MKKTHFLLISIIILSMYACTNETFTEMSEKIRVIGHLEKTSRIIFVHNEALTDTYWVENDSIGIYNSTQQNILYRALKGGKSTEFITQDVELTFEKDKKICAYYPYTDSIKGYNIKLPITKNLKSTDTPVSFMFSNSNMSENVLNLQFNHLYAYLKITLKTTDFTDRFSEREGIGIHISSDEYISTSNAWFNLETSKILHDEKGASKSLSYVCDNINFNKVDTLTYMIPILPQSDGTTVTVSYFRPSNKEGYIYTYRIMSKETPSGGFKAGHVYTINTIGAFKPSSEQYEILEDLYYSTNGHIWNNNNNWLTDKPLKEWFGLDNGKFYNTYVNYIRLYENNLTGMLPESFAKLMDSAQNIDLSFNGMSGDIPEAIKTHKKWENFGWNIIAQDTRLSDGFNLYESNLHLPLFENVILLDNSNINIQDIVSKNKLTQIICHYPEIVDDMKTIIRQCPKYCVNEKTGFR